MNQYVTKTDPMELHHVAFFMRDEDVEECKAGGKEPLAALYQGFEAGPTWTLWTPSDEPAAILGVHDTDSDGYGMIWLLGTHDIEEYPMTFLKHSKPVLDELFQGYNCLYNYSYYKNEVHHKWLRWLGFTLAERQGDWIPFYKWRN